MVWKILIVVALAWLAFGVVGIVSTRMSTTGAPAENGILISGLIVCSVFPASVLLVVSAAGAIVTRFLRRRRMRTSS